MGSLRRRLAAPRGRALSRVKFASLTTRHEKSLARLYVEPPSGVEPETCSLRVSCSTTELGWRAELRIQNSE